MERKFIDLHIVMDDKNKRTGMSNLKTSICTNINDLPLLLDILYKTVCSLGDDKNKKQVTYVQKYIIKKE